MGPVHTYSYKDNTRYEVSSTNLNAIGESQSIPLKFKEAIISQQDQQHSQILLVFNEQRDSKKQHNKIQANLDQLINSLGTITQYEVLQDLFFAKDKQKKQVL